MLKIDFKKVCAMIIGLALLLLVMALFRDFLRIILVIPFVLFLPGYLLTAVLFPKNDLDPSVRAAISVGLSIIIVPLIGFLLNFSDWGINFLPMMISLIILDTVLLVPAWYRRTKLPVNERFPLRPRIGSAEGPGKSKESKVIHYTLLVTCILIVDILVCVFYFPRTGDGFTEFYIAGWSQEASGYPEQLRVGEYGTVNAVIVNNEHEKTVYRMDIKVDGDILRSISPIVLEHLETWNEIIPLNPEKPSEAAKVEFLLYRENQDEAPYRQLRFWIKVLP